MKVKKTFYFLIFIFCVICFKDNIFLSAEPIKEQQKIEFTNQTKDLEEIVIGDKKAPITVIVYLSFTCSFCTKFIDNVLPKLSELAYEKAIKIYLRNVIDNQTSKHAAMFIRFLGGNDIEKVKELYLLTFRHQDELLKIKTDQDVLSFLNKILPNEKMTAEKIAECKNNNEIHLGLEKLQFETKNTFGISSSPSIVIIKNGKSEVHQGFMSYDDIVKKIQ